MLDEGRQQCQSLFDHWRHPHPLLSSGDAGLGAARNSPVRTMGRPGMHLPLCHAGGTGGDGLHARTPGTTLPADPANPKRVPSCRIPLGSIRSRFTGEEIRQSPGATTSGSATAGALPFARVVLFLGRLSFHSKAHPLPLYRALDRLSVDRELVLLECGHIYNIEIAEGLRAAEAAFPTPYFATTRGTLSRK